MQRLLLLITLCLAATLTSSCGQKGPLVLPQEDSQNL